MKFSDRVRQFLGETSGHEGDDSVPFSKRGKKKAKKVGKVQWDKKFKSYMDVKKDSK